LGLKKIVGFEDHRWIKKKSLVLGFLPF